MSSPAVRAAPAGSSEAISGFRPEIQALRTVAVLGVILFHLWPGALPGGFIGVDVFFVISGYLITMHLIKERERSGRIALSRFYARRIRRLLPAAMLVLAVTTVGVLALVPVERIPGFLRQIGASALYVQNWVLAAESVDYFAAEGPESPVQHYWSLSVEEQFYLVWPLLLILAFVIVVRRGGSSATPVLLGVLGTVGALSFAYAAVATAQAPQPAYFSTFTHAWEFAAGALLATAHLRGWDPGRVSRGAGAALLWASFAVIAACMFLFDGSSGVPGPLTLIPIAAVLVIMAVRRSDARWSPTALIQSRPVQFLGDTSYSAYLWHWPLIVLLPYALGRTLDLGDNLAILAVTILLAWLTRKFVEKPPLRSAVWARRRVSYGFAIVSAAVVVTGCAVPTVAIASRSTDVIDRLIAGVADPASCVGSAALRDPGACDPGEAIDPSLALGEIGYDALAVDVAERTGSSGTCVDAPQEARDCTFTAAGDADVTVAVVGDSHVEHLLPAFASLPSATGWNVESFEKRSCPFIVPTWRATGDAEYKQNDPDCIQWRERMLAELVADPDVDVVVTTTYAHRVGEDGDEAGRQEMTRALAETWRVLADAGKRVVVIADTPVAAENDITACLAGAGSTRDCAAPRDVALPPDPLAASVDPSDPAQTLIDLTDDFCVEDVCLAVAGGVAVYADRHHLSPAYALTLAPPIAAGIESALRR